MCLQQKHLNQFDYLYYLTVPEPIFSCQDIYGMLFTVLIDDNPPWSFRRLQAKFQNGE